MGRVATQLSWKKLVTGKRDAASPGSTGASSGTFMTVHLAPVMRTAFVVAIIATFCGPIIPGTALAQKQGRADAAAAGRSGGDETTRLQQRVEQLEEQLVDLQVTIGTLESLMRKGGGGRMNSNVTGPVVSDGGFGGNGADEGRLQIMETQIGALSKQIEQLTQRFNGGPSANASGAGWQNSTRTGDATSYGLRDSVRTGRPDRSNGGFDDVTVTSDGQAQPQSFQNTQPKNNAEAGAGGLSPQNANFDNRPPRVIYDEAYKYLLVQDYGAAETAFKTFLRGHPNDALAGNAQYWLGESFYVRGQYKNAAGAFLKGYTVYAKNVKAPDSLLKLAMSLKRLGQKQAACDTFSELGKRFPRAPSHIKQRARSESRRSGC